MSITLGLKTWELNGLPYPRSLNLYLTLAESNTLVPLFSGFYMGTEIGARNLCDESRYNLIPVVAKKMGLEVKSKDRLWKDRAMLEVNAAVLYSFRKHGIRIINHHEASKKFMQHLEKEKSCGAKL